MTAAQTYSEWSESLGDHFFHEGRSGQPVTFFVDDELIARLDGSDDPDTAVEHFAAAVRSRLAPDSYRRRFERVDRESRLWKVNGAVGYPPSLPLLAAAVLAGSRMAREKGISRNNYWTRFRDLLDLHERNDLKGINDVLPGLWEQLTWWLDEVHGGGLGRSTVEKDDWWTIIGYALSQALFRESDRQLLTDLFRRIGLEPGEQPSARELLQYFKAWAPGSSLSLGAKHMAADERYDERLTSILLDEASSWDGVLRDGRGRRLGALVLQYEPAPRPTYSVAAEHPAGFPDEATFSGGGASRHLSSSIDGWYDEVWPLDARWLDDGLRLESGEFLLVYQAAPVVPLARNRELGCWASVPRVEPGESYLVLAATYEADDVERFLAAHARDEWERAADAFALPGWVLFTNVVIEESLTDIPSGPVDVLAPKLRERPTLRGGLSLEGNVALYLCGGEPDLWLPSLLSPDTQVELDGKPIRATAGQRISLRSLRPPAGQHELRVGVTTLRFTTTRSFHDSDVPGTGALGHLLQKSDDHYVPRSMGATQLPEELPTGIVAVSGARVLGLASNLPSSRPTVVLPLSARRYFLVGARPGEVEEPKQPERPGWLDDAGHGDEGDALFPIGFEVSPDFDVVWVIVERSGRTAVRLRHERQALAEVAKPSLAVNEWCGVFDTEPPLSGEALELWRQYHAIASACPRLSPEDAERERSALIAAAKPRRKPRNPEDDPKPELLVGKLLRLPLVRRTAELLGYESRDKRFQVTYWIRDRNWVATERRDERSKDRERLGRFKTEDEAIRAVEKAIHTVRTVRRGVRR